MFKSMFKKPCALVFLCLLCFAACAEMAPREETLQESQDHYSSLAAELRHHIMGFLSYKDQKSLGRTCTQSREDLRPFIDKVVSQFDRHCKSVDRMVLVDADCLAYLSYEPALEALACRMSGAAEQRINTLRFERMDTVSAGVIRGLLLFPSLPKFVAQFTMTLDQFNRQESLDFLTSGLPADKEGVRYEVEVIFHFEADDANLTWRSRIPAPLPDASMKQYIVRLQKRAHRRRAASAQRSYVGFWTPLEAVFNVPVLLIFWRDNMDLEVLDRIRAQPFFFAREQIPMDLQTLFAHKTWQYALSDMQAVGPTRAYYLNRMQRQLE